MARLARTASLLVLALLLFHVSAGLAKRQLLQGTDENPPAETGNTQTPQEGNDTPPEGGDTTPEGGNTPPDEGQQNAAVQPTDEGNTSGDNSTTSDSSPPPPPPPGPDEPSSASGDNKTVDIPTTPQPTQVINVINNVNVINNIVTNVVNNVVNNNININNINTNNIDITNVNTFGVSSVTYQTVTVQIFQKALVDIYSFDSRRGNPNQFFYDLQIIILWILKSSGCRS